jgi:hypothetical protein
MNSNTLKTFAHSAGKAMVAVVVVAGLVFAIGCGGGGSATAAGPTPTPTPGTANSASAQVRFGDAPADSVISFEVTVSALTLTPSGGGAAVSIPVGANNRVELSHASGKFEPFALGNLPQGTFTAANLTLTNAELTFLSGTGTPVHINGPASAQITVPLSPALTIGTSPLIISIDVNLATSVTLAGGVVNGIAFGPTSFTITAKAPGAQANQQDDDGEIEDVRGTVTSATANSFVLSVGQSKSSLTFSFDSTTQFSDGATAATLANQIVKVEGFTRADGSLFAKEVEGLESNTGSELEGLITAISGTTLTISADDGIGNGMDDTKIGSSFTVNIAGLAASKFKFDSGNGFGSSVPNTLTFGPTTIHQGQRVEVESNVAVPPANGSVTPDKIKLQQQGVSGTVANLAANTFDLNLAADSHLRIISGQTVVHVTRSAVTDVRTTPANGAVVAVRGLLFWDGTAWQMIARRIR